MLCRATVTATTFAILLLIPFLAWSQGRDVGCSPTVANPCTGGGGGGGGGGYTPPGHRGSSRDDAEEQERLRYNALTKRYNAMIRESNAAYEAGRYREAVQLKRKAVELMNTFGDEADKRSSQKVLENAAIIERYADSEDARKAGNAALEAGHLAKALAYFQEMLRYPPADNQGNRKFVADLQARIQAEKEQQERAEKDRLEREAQNRKTAEVLRQKIGEFIAMLDTAPPSSGPTVIRGGTASDHFVGTHRANALQLQFGDPDADEAHAAQSGQGFDTPGRLKGSKAVPKVTAPTPKLVLTASDALRAQIPEQAKGDPLVRNSLAWYERLDTMKAETTQKIAAIKAQQKSGNGDPAVLAAQLGTLTNENKRIEKDQAKARTDIKERVKNLGLDWNESAPEGALKAKLADK